MADLVGVVAGDDVGVDVVERQLPTQIGQPLRGVDAVGRRGGALGAARPVVDRRRSFAEQPIAGRRRPSPRHRTALHAGRPQDQDGNGHCRYRTRVALIHSVHEIRLSVTIGLRYI